MESDGGVELGEDGVAFFFLHLNACVMAVSSLMIEEHSVLQDHFFKGSFAAKFLQEIKAFWIATLGKALEGGRADVAVVAEGEVFAQVSGDGVLLGSPFIFLDASVAIFVEL